MPRSSDRTSRTDRYRRVTDEEQLTDSYTPPEEEAPEASMGGETEGGGRRRRRQAQRMLGDDGMAGGAPEDTYVPSPRSASYADDDARQGARPGGRRGRTQGFASEGDELYDSRFDEPYEDYAPKERNRGRDSAYSRYAQDRYGDEDDRYDAREPGGRYPDDGLDDEDDYGYDYDEDGPPRKKRTLKWIIIALVLLVVIAAVTYIGIRRPDFVEPIVQWGRELVLGPTPTPEPTLEPTPEPTATPEPVPDASAAVVIGFMATPMTQSEVGPVDFEITTTAQTDRIEILNNNGERLIEGTPSDYTDTDYGRSWRLRVHFTGPYEGNVEAVPGNESGWNDPGGATLPIKVGGASMAGEAPADTNVAPVDGGGGDAGAPDGVADATQSMAGTDAQVAQLTGDAVLPGGGVVATAAELETQAYDRSGPVDSYKREKSVNFADADTYRGGETGMHGMLTFRGSNLRQNGAYGLAAPTENRLETVWTAEAGIASDGDKAFGSQPIIVQWHANIRQMMALNEDKAEKKVLREVIFAGNNGNLYFFDLEDGTATRAAVQADPTMPMMGTPSVYPLGYPMLAVGSGDPLDMSLEEETGLQLYNLIRNSHIGMLPGTNEDALSSDPTVITSPLIDNATDTIFSVGGNGMLYSMQLGTTLDGNEKLLSLAPVTEIYRAGSQGEDTTVDASMAAYGEFAYFATNGGVLQCVNLNTFENVWALNIGADCDAAPAIDLQADGEESYTPALYHASKTDVEGLAHMRRIDAATGEVLWDQTVPGSISASPLIGTGPLESMVFFSAMNSDAGGTVYALDKATGEVLWQYSVLGRQLASPIAIYDETGGAWLVQGDEGGLLLLDAAAGERLDYLTLDGAVYGSPAAFNDMIVVATQTGQIHGVQLK